MINQSIGKRTRANRSPQAVPTLVKFQLEDIIKHYKDSYSVIYNQLSALQSSGTLDESQEFVLRSILVYSSSIMDFYFHELGKVFYLKMIIGDIKESNDFKKMELPLEDIREALSKQDPNEWFIKSIVRTMHKSVFQSSEQIKGLLKSIDISVNEICNNSIGGLKGWNVIKEKLDEIYRIRNQIAHQADRSHSNADYYEIDLDDIKKKVEFCHQFVQDIHQFVSKKIS